MKKIYLLFIACIAGVTAFGQEVTEPLKEKRWTIGIRGVAPVWSERLPEGFRYAPYGVLPFVTYDFTKKDKPGDIYLSVEPAFMFFHHGSKHEYEGGLNVGVGYQYMIKKVETALFTTLETGPYYYTTKTVQEWGPWIWSGTFILGIRKQICEKWSTEIHGRLRHISNGNIHKPNGGINNFMIGIGVARRI